MRILIQISREEIPDTLGPLGLVNSNITGLIGPGVVVHLPSFFEEFDNLREKGLAHTVRHSRCARLTEVFVVGLDCSGRLFISDRAHLVFDFHQIVDGLKEVELGGSSYGLTISLSRSRRANPGDYSIGTTKKGIGPAYSAKASRSGLRVHHLFDPTFAEKFRKIVEGRYKRYGHFEYDTEGEIERYKVRGFERAPAASSIRAGWSPPPPPPSCQTDVNPI